MGCICCLEGFGGVSSKNQYSDPSRGSEYNNTKVEVKPFNRERNVSPETPSFYYPNSRDRDPSRGSEHNNTKVWVESFNRERNVSPETPSLCYLDSRYRDPSRDCDHTGYSEHVLELSTRVEHLYHAQCPFGWKFIGIKINERETENWVITYHGTKSHVFNSICREGYKVGPRDAYGRGVYPSPSIEVASGYAEIFTFEGATYIGVLQNRVNQNHVNIVSGGQIWVCPDPANIIPCGLCVKEVNPGYPYYN